MVTAFSGNQLTQQQFQHIANMVTKLTGIQLPAGKEELVKGRLSRRIRALGLRNFDEYLDYLDKDKSGRELSQMLDAITTNVTSFFREPAHFQFLRDTVIPQAAQANRHLRIWSAGCSNGAEPYSVAMTLREAIPDLSRWDVQIVSTDVSTTMLEQVKAGVYPQEVLRSMEPKLLQKYFTPQVSNGQAGYQAKAELRDMLRIGHLNLLNAWPSGQPFDVIFCRNVMIYFDRPTRTSLVNRFAERLRPGGHLLVGHAESLTGTATNLDYVRPAVYRKPGAAAPVAGKGVL